MKKIKINIPNNGYTVYLGNNTFSQLPNILEKENFLDNYLLVIDKNVSELYKKQITGLFSKSKKNIVKVIINSSEKNKSYGSVQLIHSALIDNNFGRDSIIIAIGGGIIGDIAGFAASTFMRGIKYVQIPTTLLASVDSSVGGKTGINFNDTKNIIGSFYQPQFVLIDPEFFNTLPEEEKLCGLGEIIKYSFLINEKYYSLVKNNYRKILNCESAIVSKVISESIKFKGDVVTRDEKEVGVRKILNLGHTFAHALEVQQEHKLKHGQAVIVGITCALYLSKELNLVSDVEFKEYIEFLNEFSPHIKLRKVDTDMVLNIMQRDKKNRNNEIKLVLLSSVGVIVTDLAANRNLIKQSLSQGISHF